MFSVNEAREGLGESALRRRSRTGEESGKREERRVRFGAGDRVGGGGVSVRGFANAVAEFPEGVMGPSPSSEAADRPISGSAGHGSSTPPPSRQRGAVSQASSGSPVGLSTGRWLRSATVSPAANRAGSTRLLVPAGAGGRRSQRNLDRVAGRSPSSDTADRPISGSAGPGSRTPPALPAARRVLASVPRQPGGSLDGPVAPVGEGVSRRESGGFDATPRRGRGRRPAIAAISRPRRSPAVRRRGSADLRLGKTGLADFPALPAARRAFTGIPRRPGGFLDGLVAPVGEGVSRRESGGFDATPSPGWERPVVAGEGGGGRRSPRGRDGAVPVVRRSRPADLRFGRAGLVGSLPAALGRFRRRPAAARWVSRRAGGSGRRRGLAPRIGRVRRDSPSRRGAAAGDRDGRSGRRAARSRKRRRGAAPWV